MLLSIVMFTFLWKMYYGLCKECLLSMDRILSFCRSAGVRSMMPPVGVSMRDFYANL